MANNAKFNGLVKKVRGWANKPDTNALPDAVIEDCLTYAADECYRVLRIPPLEKSTVYTVTDVDNKNDSTELGGVSFPSIQAYTSFLIPEDLTQFNMLRALPNPNLGTPYSMYPGTSTIVFNEVTDKRTFFDMRGEKYSLYNWMWMNNRIYIHPQLEAGAQVDINYYCRLCALNAMYEVNPLNYVIGVADANQPYLEINLVDIDYENVTPLWFSGTGVDELCFATEAEAVNYAVTAGGVPYLKEFTGREVPNWLRDENERLLLWGSLANIAGYLFDDKMEQRYSMRFNDTLNSLNKEEKWRRASGGNVQMNFNGGSLI